jgi:hypothetical protein
LREKSEENQRLSFFADENFSPRLVKILRLFDEKGCEFCHLLERFEQGTADEVWIPQIGTWTPKPIVLCGDGRILTNKARSAAVKDTGTHFVFLTAGFVNAGFKEQVKKVLSGWEEMCQVLRKTKEPTIYEFRMHGSVKKYQTLAEIKLPKPEAKHRDGETQRSASA